jgi:hypothetical protein
MIILGKDIPDAVPEYQHRAIRKLQPHRELLPANQGHLLRKWLGRIMAKDLQQRMLYAEVRWNSWSGRRPRERSSRHVHKPATFLPQFVSRKTDNCLFYHC